MENQTRVLERLHAASHLLRRISRFLNLYKKLENTKDGPNVASLLYELDPLMVDEELEKIDFIQKERSAVEAIGQRLNRLTNRDFLNGLQNENESILTNSLQVGLQLHKIL